MSTQRTNRGRSCSVAGETVGRRGSAPVPRFLAQAGQLLAATIDEKVTLRTVARLVIPEFADVCLIGLAGVDDQPGQLVIHRRDGSTIATEASLVRASSTKPESGGAQAADGPIPGGPVRLRRTARLTDGPPPELAAAYDIDESRYVQLQCDVASAITVPMILRQRRVGTLMLGFGRSDRRYSPSDLPLAQALALLLGSAIDNGRLYRAEQAARQVAEQVARRSEQLRAMTAELADLSDWNMAALRIVDRTVETAGAIAGSVAWLDHEGDELRVVRSRGYRPSIIQRFGRFPVTADLPLAEAVRRGEPLFFETRAALMARFPHLDGSSRRRGAWAVQPLTLWGRTVGAVGLSFTRERTFAEEERRFLAAVAEQCALGLERAMLHQAERAALERAEQASHRMQLLADASIVLSASLDQDAILSRLARLIVPQIGDWIVVDLVDDDGRLSRALVHHADPSQLAAAQPLLEPLAPWFRDAIGDDLVPDDRSRLITRLTGAALTEAKATRHARRAIRALGLRSYLAVPLIARGRSLGVLRLLVASDERQFGEADRSFAEELGRRVAMAIDNARLFRLERTGRESRDQLVRQLTEFKLSLDATADSVWMFRPETLRLFYANRRTIQATGYSLEELLERTALDLQPSNETPRFQSVLATLLADPDASDTIVTTLRRRDGSTFPAELSMRYVQLGGEDGRVIAISRDITDRVESRARLQRLAQSERALNAELRAIIRAMNDAVLVLDWQGRVVFANPAADALFDRPIHHLDDVARELVDPEQRMPRAGLDDPQGPVAFQVAGSHDRWLELNAYPVLGAGDLTGDEGSGEASETILFLRDITSQRRSQLARQAFLGVLSHELRTPVTAIFGSSKLLTRRPTLPPDVREELRADIEGESERLYRLVEDLLVLAHAEDDADAGVAPMPDLEPLLLQRIVPAMIRVESQRWPEASFETELAPDLPAVRGEQTYVEQILRNLLSNAAKYGGRDHARVRVRLDLEPRGIAVRVLDEGPGFDATEAHHLFDLFYRSGRAVKAAAGAGIGLYVCRRLVETMGGEIWARPRPEGGAEFGFVLQLFLEEGAVQPWEVHR